MRTVMTSLLLGAAALTSGTAGAQQQINIFFPFDSAACATWSKYAGNNAIRQQYEFWILGLVSGHNYASPARQVPTGKLPAGEALYVQLDEYCKENPSSSVVGGAFRLIEQLRETIPATKPKAIPTKTEAAKAEAVKGEATKAAPVAPVKTETPKAAPAAPTAPTAPSK